MKFVKIAIIALALVATALPDLASACCRRHHRRCGGGGCCATSCAPACAPAGCA